MDEGFICCYSDILFTPDIVGRLAAAKDDMAVGVDTQWLTRYEGRTDHPPDDAEKLRRQAAASAVSIGRCQNKKPTASTSASPKFSPAGAAKLREQYHRVRREFAGRPWREAAIFEKAYLILLFQEMIERGARFCPRRHARRIHRSRYPARL